MRSFLSTTLNKLVDMDKQIKKVVKDYEKGDKKKAHKDTSKLMKMDKKFDKKVAMCEKKMSKKGMSRGK